MSEPKNTSIDYDGLGRRLESIAPRPKPRTNAPSVDEIRAALTTYAQIDDEGEPLDSEDVPVGPEGDAPGPDFLDFADAWLEQNPDASPDDLIPMETDRAIGDRLQGLDVSEYARQTLSELPPEIQEIIDRATHGEPPEYQDDGIYPLEPRAAVLAQVDDSDQADDVWDDIIRRVQDSGQDTRCPQCPGDQPMILGPLGDLLHVRCQHCGWDYALKIPPEEPLPEPEKPGLPTDLARDDSNRFVQLGGHVLPSGSQIRRAHHSRETQADEPRNLGEEPKDEAHRCPKCGGSGNYVGGRFTEENPGTCYACGGTGRKKASVSNRFTRFTQSGNPMGDVGDLLDFNARGGRKFLSGKDYPKVCPTCQATIDDLAQLFEQDEMPDTDDPEAPIMFAYDHALLCGGRNCAEREQHEQNRFKTREQEDAEHEEFMAKGRGRLEDDLEMKGIGLASASNPSLVRMANLGQVGRGIGKFFSDPINAVGAGAVAGTLMGGAAAISGDRAYHQQQQGKQLLPRIPSKWNMQHRFDQPTQRVENPNQFVQHNFIDPYKEQGSYTLTPSQATPQQKMQFLHKHLYEIDKKLRDPNTTLLDRSRLQRQKLHIMGAGKVTRYEAGMGGGVSTDDMVNYFQQNVNPIVNYYPSRYVQGYQSVPYRFQQNVNPMASRSTTASSNSRFIRLAQSGGSRVIYQGPEGLVLQAPDGGLEVFAPTETQAPGTISIGGQTYAPVRTIPPQDAEELMSDIDVQDMADRYDPSGMGGVGPGPSVAPAEMPGFDMMASSHPRFIRIAAHEIGRDPGNMGEYIASMPTSNLESTIREIDEILARRDDAALEIARPGARPNPNNPNWMANAAGPIRNI